MSNQDEPGSEIQAPERAIDEIPDEELAAETAGEDAHADPDAFEESPEEAPEAAEAARSWRVAKSLLKLRDQVNARAPRRSKRSDGTIGDRRHCGVPRPTSDHCPHVRDGSVGVVTAMDITHDPAGGCDAGDIAQAIVNSRDQRAKDVVWNRRIASAPGWNWRPYTRPNPHTTHVHVSVKATKSLYDSTANWSI